ncbi:hypothetical protein GGR57DRAFT_503608 [Xylariaceae sp. FL1272]|nr:hypothetical protein GGR57DRAFT_503608 [Xylariaceae sp. FL1272]
MTYYTAKYPIGKRWRYPEWGFSLIGDFEGSGQPENMMATTRDWLQRSRCGEIVYFNGYNPNNPKKPERFSFEDFLDVASAVYQNPSYGKTTEQARGFVETFKGAKMTLINKPGESTFFRGATESIPDHAFGNQGLVELSPDLDWQLIRPWVDDHIHTGFRTQALRRGVGGQETGVPLGTVLIASRVRRILVRGESLRYYDKSMKRAQTRAADIYGQTDQNYCGSLTGG